MSAPSRRVASKGRPTNLEDRLRKSAGGRSSNSASTCSTATPPPKRPTSRPVRPASAPASGLRPRILFDSHSVAAAKDSQSVAATAPASSSQRPRRSSSAARLAAEVRAASAAHDALALRQKHPPPDTASNAPSAESCSSCSVVSHSPSVGNGSTVAAGVRPLPTSGALFGASCLVHGGGAGFSPPKCEHHPLMANGQPNRIWDSSGVSQALAGWLPPSAIRCLPKAETIAQRPLVWHTSQCDSTREQRRPRSAPQSRRVESVSPPSGKKLGIGSDQNGNVVMFVR